MRRFRYGAAARYVRIFFEAHGEPPWPCGVCGEMTDYGRNVGLIHHRDHDRTNNAIENLEAAHWGCHQKHHHSGRPKSPETRQRMTEGQARIVASRKRGVDGRFITHLEECSDPRARRQT